MSFLTTIGSIAAPVVGGLLGGPAGAVAGAGLSKVFAGIGQGQTAAELAKQNVRPVDTPEDAYYQNEAEANQRAEQGMGAQQYANSENNIQRSQNLGIRTSQNQGNSLAALGNLVATGDQATNNLNQQDYVDKTQNQDMAYKIRQQLAARQQQAFDWNDKQKFLENAAAVRALTAASQQNIFGGLNTAAGIGNTSTNPYTGQQTTSPSTGGIFGKLKGLFGGSGGYTPSGDGPIDAGSVPDIGL